MRSYRSGTNSDRERRGGGSKMVCVLEGKEKDHLVDSCVTVWSRVPAAALLFGGHPDL